MMEIPAGKKCEGCPFVYEADIVDQDGDDRFSYSCSLFHPDRFPDLREYCDYTSVSDDPLRHKKCLSAYPNGATIEIKPKEVSE